MGETTLRTHVLSIKKAYEFSQNAISKFIKKNSQILNAHNIASATKILNEIKNTQYQYGNPEEEIEKALDISTSIGIFVNSINARKEVDLATGLTSDLDISEIITARDRLENLLTRIIDSDKPELSHLKFQDEITEQEKSLYKLLAHSGVLAEKIKHLEESLAEKSAPIDLAANKAEVEINALTTNIRSLAAHKSQELVLGNYRDSALSEKATSDKFRTYSTVTMVTAVLFAIYSLVASTNTFTLEVVILKISISILLSIPAAYFARESAKHRRQQYLYQQYALNLDALNPFIAELEPADKNALKAEIARKLFTSSHESTNSKDENFPINASDLLTLLISKVELKPASPTKSEKPNS